MKKQLGTLAVLIIVVGVLVFQKYCNNPKNELTEKLDGIYMQARPNLEFSATLLPVFALSKEVTQLNLGMDTDWDMVKVTATQLNNEVSQLTPPGQRRAEQLQRSLQLYATRINSNVDKAKLDKAALETEVAKPGYVVVGIQINPTKHVEEKKAVYSTTIQAIIKDNEALQTEITNYGKTVSNEVGALVAHVDIGSIEEDASREAFDDFSQKIDETITGTSASGVSENEETGRMIQSVFGQGLTGVTLQRKFESRGKKR